MDRRRLLQPVRDSWATGQSIVWTKVHDLPDFVYFNHEIHVNKGIGCESCHGQVNEMPIMYQQNTLQMEWCLNCHRNPAENLRPTSEIYNMDWKKPSELNPVWCAATGVKPGTPTARRSTAQRLIRKSAIRTGLAQPDGNGECPMAGASATDAPKGVLKTLPASYQKFTSQEELGTFLFKHYNIRPARELSNCEICHR